jgi:glucan phosphoethanolaminetransferase (alkaline phosphatase superfamily)
MSVAGLSYFLAAGFWFLTALYGVLASQAFIQEQFLTPRLFDPLALFADWHSLISALVLAIWAAIRAWKTGRSNMTFTWAVAVVWLGVTAFLAVVTPLSARHTMTDAMGIAGAGVFLVLVLAAAELGLHQKNQEVPARDRSRADLLACLLGASIVTIAQATAAVWASGPSGATIADLLQTLRLHLLVAAAAFLAFSAVRGAAALLSRPIFAETILTTSALAGALAIFASTTFLGSISIGGVRALALAAALGTALACAFAARGGAAQPTNDGVIRAFRALSPGVTAHWWGLAIWTACLVGLVVAVEAASRTADWNFLLLRTGVALIWLLALSAALTFSRRLADGGARISFALVALILAVHIALQASMMPVQASTLRNPSGKWFAEILEGDIRTEGVGDLVRFLHAQTNIPRDTPVEAVDVTLAPLTGSPSIQRPHVFLFVVDSLRRDYLAPYNPAVTFTPAIATLAQDSLVFKNAFTQYGATGLSVPALWVGASILHKQYVSSFPRMNALAKLLAHEQYDQWISMEHITNVILPPSASREPLDAGVPVKDFRLCKTLEEVRFRLANRAASAPPIFAYSLPQDVHISVVTREGAHTIDEGDYTGFYAPVASRVRRFDACLGDFVNDLKARGLYDQSVIILTSDHGDSLGEDGRMGHAYSLYPEIVRVPLIVHVPPALRSAWAWNETRPTFSTDITPTLYRLLGHEPTRPSSFFGESLALSPGAPAAPRGPRMLAASYGAVYGALLADARSYYVFDAIAMRERAFELGDGPGYEEALVTPGTREQGLKVIRETVSAISSFYRFPTSVGSAP